MTPFIASLDSCLDVASFDKARSGRLQSQCERQETLLFTVCLDCIAARSELSSGMRAELDLVLWGKARPKFPRTVVRTCSQPNRILLYGSHLLLPTPALSLLDCLFSLFSEGWPTRSSMPAFQSSSSSSRSTRRSLFSVRLTGGTRTASSVFTSPQFA